MAVRGGKTDVERRAESGTRERLLAVACRIFAERGYKRTRTQDICRLAGVNPAAVNYHFGGKEGIYRAVWDSALESTLESSAFSPALSSDAHRDWLYRYVHACVLSVFDPGMPGVLRKLMTHEVADPSPISNDILANHIAPRYPELLGHLRAMIGTTATDYQIGCCIFAINALFGSIAINKTARRALFKGDTPAAGEIEQFAREICAFVMGGIRALRTVPQRTRAGSAPASRG
ncbi:MAG: TetR/AcrR family transcriptional regulator [Kiritimatiellae bacterium]|nr:TetR/AcrR family transcriptional regulator [Kiritimatiellia bacterium]